MSSSGSPSSLNSTNKENTISGDVDLPVKKLEKKIKKSFFRNANQLSKSENSWLTEFVCASGVRKVSKAWMEIMDKLLEARLVAMIEDCVPNSGLDDLVPSAVPRLDISKIAFDTLNVYNRICYPSFMEDYDGKSPFIGCGLVMTFKNKKPNYDGISLVIEDFSIIYADHLSVLCLSEMHLDLPDFICLLKGSKNIKILIIQEFRLAVNSMEELCKTRLPVIPNLKSLLLLKHFKVYTTMNNEKNKAVFEGCRQLFEYKTWFFNAYAPQLENLEIRHVKKLKFDALPALKQLSVVTSSNKYVIPLNIGNLTSLEKLCVSSYRHVDNKVNDVTFYKFMGRFACTLKEVYADIKLVHTAQSELDPGVIGLRFRHVRKLTLNISRLSDDKLFLLDFVLPKFPSLKKLFMLDYEKKSYPYPFHHTFEKPTTGPSSFRDMIWQQCAELKIIAILKWKCNPKHPTGFYSQVTLARPKTK